MSSVCVFCDIGADMSTYHVMMHEIDNMKKFQAFHDQLLNEPLPTKQTDFTPPHFDNIHQINTKNGYQYNFDTNEYYK